MAKCMLAVSLRQRMIVALNRNSMLSESLVNIVRSICSDNPRIHCYRSRRRGMFCKSGHRGKHLSRSVTRQLYSTDAISPSSLSYDGNTYVTPSDRSTRTDCIGSHRSIAVSTAIDGVSSETIVSGQDGTVFSIMIAECRLW